MTTSDSAAATAPEAERPPDRVRGGKAVVAWLTTTDHTKIGTLYLVTSFAFFIIGGVMALLMRAELARPGMQILSNEQFNQAFTMHGTIMLLMFATPLFAGFTNWIMPLQIGAPDVAFPRLNMLAYWFYLFGSLIAVGGFLTPRGAADFGWFAYAPLNDATHSPGIGGDMWIMGLAFSGFGTLFMGFHGTFLVQHWLGAEGMPRRYADYLAADSFTALNTISTISSFLLGLSVFPFLYNIWKTAKYGEKIEADDPWGYGRSIEWVTSCPPPRHNFLSLPRIRSGSPAFDLHHPDVAAAATKQLPHHSPAQAPSLGHGESGGKR
ncbi:cbb3-type cytochrome c oxidase subunit I [Streptomyces sp. NPDC013178]|uniref:cbb3-type cytochrome c oxidase subunit I n=1 Tax=Streptomyces sp. NPDC013178 TaxID=3155118 RepID=UPI0033ECFE4A